MIAEIQAKFSQDKFEYSEHALQQGLSRKIRMMRHLRQLLKVKSLKIIRKTDTAQVA